MSQVGNLDAAIPDGAAFSERDLRSLAKTQHLAKTHTRRDTMVAVLVIRAAIFIIGVLSLSTTTSLSQIDPKVASGTSWIAFDSNAYRYILLHGYPHGPQIPYQIAYFPLFPLVARMFTPLCTLLLGADAAPRAAMLMVSNACSLIGLFFLYEWVASLINAKTAAITTILLAVYPGSVFFCAGLTEAPFFMLVTIAVYLLYQQRIVAAALVSALATLCRPTGVALALTIVAWTFYNSQNLSGRRLLMKLMLIGGISLAGAISYQCFIWQRYHHFDAYERSQEYWDPSIYPQGGPPQADEAAPPAPAQSADQGQTNQGQTNQSGTNQGVTSVKATEMAAAGSDNDYPRYSAAFFISRLMKTQGWNRIIALALLGILIAAYFRPVGIPRVLLLLPLSIFLISYLPNWGLRASSLFRYESASIPLFVVLAVWLSNSSRKTLLFTIMTLSMALQMYYAFRFSRGLWVG
jgi:hypothetical protein